MKLKELKRDGYNLYEWRLNEHSGTHLDAPLHFSDTGISADQIPAETLVVPLAVINVADKAAEIRTTGSHAMILPHGNVGTGDCPTMPASQCTPAGRGTLSIRRNISVRMRAA